MLALILIAALTLLGRWQWDVSQSQRGTLQNLLYAFQWWTMAAMVIYGWWRLLRDDVYGRPTAGLTTARPLMTTDDKSWDTFDTSTPAITAAQEQDDHEPDPELAEYNNYLSRLNARSERAR